MPYTVRPKKRGCREMTEGSERRKRKGARRMEEGKEKEWGKRKGDRRWKRSTDLNGPFKGTPSKDLTSSMKPHL